MESLVPVLLVSITVLSLIGLYLQWRAVARLEERLITVVMDVHDESRFYHNAGRSSAQHQLDVERMNIERIQAEADKAKAETRRMEEERLSAKQRGEVAGDPKHGNRGLRRTVIEPVGGPNG
tara:strand:+ start:922 stop:1287 length:366 start_codon:yes stop_codon:yes gene_type:complete